MQYSLLLFRIILNYFALFPVVSYSVVLYCCFRIISTCLVLLLYTVTKRELVCVFPFLGKKLLEIKKYLYNSVEKTLLPYCESKIVFKSPAIFVKQFHFTYMLAKKTLLWYCLQF